MSDKKCKWKIEQSQSGTYWESECEFTHDLFDPKEDFDDYCHWKYCPFCGKEIEFEE